MTSSPVVTNVRRGAALVLAVGLWLLAAVVPALADPSGPTNFRTVITSVSPKDAPVTVEVLGGDSYLSLDSQGNDVLLRGYDGEELYLRWLDNGRVEVNTNSVTFHQNEARYEGSVPNQGVGPEFPPEWELVATDGVYAWHDHRIHWMSEGSLPPNIDPALDEVQVAYEWPETVQLQVGATMVEVAGELLWLPDSSPLPAVLVALLSLVGVVVVGRSKPSLAIVAAVGVGVVLTTIVGAGENLGLGSGVQGQPLSLILPLIAAVAAAAATAVRDRGDAALVLSALAGVPLLVWAIAHAGALASPVLPTAPDLLVRIALGVAAGAGLGSLVVAAMQLFQTPLVPEDLATS